MTLSISIPINVKTCRAFEVVLYVSFFPSGNLYSSLTWAWAVCDQTVPPGMLPQGSQRRLYAHGETS